MNDDALAAIMARTDAAVGLLLAILIEKGVVNSTELSAILDNAPDALGAGAESALITTVFMGMKTLVDLKRHASLGSPVAATGVRTCQ